MPCGTAGFISGQLALARQNHFQKDKIYNGLSKHQVLSNYINSVNSSKALSESTGVTIPIKQFSNFLHQTLLGSPNPASGLRVYFSTTLQEYLPNDDKDTLTLVFAPALDLAKNRGDYYVYEVATKSIIKLKDVNAANNLIKDFQRGKMLVLQALETNSGNSSFNETKSIYYKIAYLENWECNALNPGSGNPQISDIRFTFGAYITSDIPIYDCNVTNQLTVQVDFLSGNKLAALNVPELQSGVSGDTGIPCPPPPPGYTTCPGA